MKTPRPRAPWSRRLVAHVALLPLMATVLCAYIGTIAWSIGVSFTSSKTLPVAKFVGLAQYVRLFGNERWMLSLQNVAVFGVLFVAGCLVIGFLLAAFIDQQVVAEAALRTVFLYPYALSFVATGLIWQWLLNPGLGLQSALQRLGFENFAFDWIANPDKVMYAIALASVWQASGLVMALMLAGLRGIDISLWHAARIEGIPTWRVYVSIVLPMLGPSIGTAFVLLSLGVVKLFDVVVAMTQGGPGLASEVPGKFIMDHLFSRANIGLASAASTMLLLTVLALLAPWIYARIHRARGGARVAHR